MFYNQVLIETIGYLYSGYLVASGLGCDLLAYPYQSWLELLCLGFPGALSEKARTADQICVGLSLKEPEQTLSGWVSNAHGHPVGWVPLS